MRKSIVALAALLLAACGSSSPSNTTAKVDQMVAFARCMRAHGVPNFPDPGSNGSGGLIIQQRAGSGGSLKVNGVGVSSPAFQSAMQSCHSQLPNGGRPPQLSAARRAQMLKFSQCMRAHGLTNFPDPTFGPGGRVGLKLPGGSEIDPNSPAFQRAQSACAKYQRGGLTAKAP